MDTVVFMAQNCADEDGNNVAMALLHNAAEEGKMLPEWGGGDTAMLVNRLMAKSGKGGGP